MSNTTYRPIVVTPELLQPIGKPQIALNPAVQPIENNKGLLAWAESEIQNAPDGQKHGTLNKVAYTLGGHIAGGTLSEEECYGVCYSAICRRDIDDEKAAAKTIIAGLNNGKTNPLVSNFKGYSEYYTRETVKASNNRTNTPEQDYKHESQVHEWQTPANIEVTLLPVPALNPDIIPDPMRPWLMDISNRMKCPPDYTAATLLVMLSSMIGTRLAIKPKQRDDWTVIPNLWGGVIGDPSVLKTPSIAEVLKPLNRIISESTKEYEQELQKYEALKVTYEAQKKVYQAQEQERLKDKKVDNPVAYPEHPAKPTERRYMTNDATIEKLGELLNENPGGLLEFRDELIGLLAGWDRAGREQDRAFHLEGWNGNGSMSIDRIGRGTLHVKNVCLSLLGGIQPAKLTGYLQAATGYENDGFVQRLQVAVYPDKIKWGYVDEYPDKPARDKAFSIIQAISQSDFAEIGYEGDDYNKFAYTRFEPEAQPVFVEWLTRWEMKVLPNETGLLSEHFAKYRSLMPSLALIFHTIDYCAGQTTPNAEGKHLVSKHAAGLAVKWCEYLETHARRIYGLLDAMHLTAAKELSRHLKKGDLQDGFKVRDVYRKKWAHLGTREQVQAAIDELKEKHWLCEVDPTPKPLGRPEEPSYLINPKITI